eukprot:scaffold42300_cov168-Amphora_coffeaeformis.AAC.3
MRTAEMKDEKKDLVIGGWRDDGPRKDHKHHHGVILNMCNVSLTCASKCEHREKVTAATSSPRC